MNTTNFTKKKHLYEWFVGHEPNQLSVKCQNQIEIHVCLHSAQQTTMIGLSKERPTWWSPSSYSWNLADFMKSSRFHVKSRDIAFPLHSIKLKSFCWVIWFIRFLGGFHEIRRISKDQLPGMVTPMIYIPVYNSSSSLHAKSNRSPLS